MSGRADATNRPRVLVADDDPMIGILAGEVLQQAGYDVTVVSNAAGVLTAFERGRPDIVMLDVEMPGGNGFDICEQIRRSPVGAHLPILMVTGLDDTSSIARAYAAGATDFILKPIHWPVLPHRIGFMVKAHQTNNALRSSEQRNQALLQAFPDWIYRVDGQGVVIEHISGNIDSRGTDFVGLRLEDSLPEDTARRARECMQMSAGTGAQQSYEFATGSGENQHTWETRLQLQSDGTYLFIVRDVSERTRAEARIQYLAYYDTLTGLPNRQLFVRELRRALRACERRQTGVALLFVDLDRFKRINDTLGHAVGDALLQAVARRLETSVRPTDVVARPAGSEDIAQIRVARLGGDEFVLMLADIHSPEEAAAVATRVRHALAEPFSAEGHQFVVTPSIGVSLYPADGTEIEDLLVKADMAMYDAKDQGRNRHVFFSDTMSGRSLDRLDLENEMRRGIAANEFTLQYQPKVDARTGAIGGVEALMRWHHPERGWISPGVFIPLAEETGMMLPLGDWAIGEACRQIGQWAGRGLGHVSIAVNVSTLQFSREDFVESVLATVREHGVNPARLELEITESLLMRDVDGIIDALRRLRNAGVRISIDDFGTGYSSLGYLKQFPVDTLKIDRSFVKDIQVSSDDAAICAAIIAMARELQLTTVAEGVEIVEQLEFLQRQGCNLIQGFLFSKPLPPAELEPLLRSGISMVDKRSARNQIQARVVGSH
jgi:diguanylate cyclase (GGDEF)-like protein